MSQAPHRMSRSTNLSSVHGGSIPHERHFNVVEDRRSHAQSRARTRLLKKNLSTSPRFQPDSRNDISLHLASYYHRHQSDNPVYSILRGLSLTNTTLPPTSTSTLHRLARL